MDLRYFIFIFFCGYLNNTVFLETEGFTTENLPQSTLFGSSVSNVSTSSPNTTGNPLSQPAQFNISSGKPLPVAYVSSAKPSIHTSAGQPLTYNITRQPIAGANISRQTALLQFSSTGQLSTSGRTSTRQSPPPHVYTSTQQLSLPVHITSGKTIQPTVPNLPTQPTTNVKHSPVITPGFNLETTSTQKPPHTANPNSTAAILVGVILTSLLVAIIVILLWKCLRKPVSNDQNWAGRSPFADGETPDLCMDNIRESEIPGKRTSIISLMPWKPNKSALLADDLEIKLFESSEHIDDSNNLKTEKRKDHVNGTSEESAGGSTIGTAVSSSDEADLPPPPPLLDLEGQESKQSDKPTMINTPPLPSDSTNLPPSLDCLNQACENNDPEIRESFPPPPDSARLSTPPGDFVKTQEDFNNEIQSQEFSIPPDSYQDFSESLPLPPAELL